MDFFQAQDNARKKSTRLVLFYAAAIVAIIVTIYAVLMAGLLYAASPSGDGATFAFSPGMLWQPELFFGTAIVTTAVIGFGSLFKTLALRSGGGVVARSLGGQLVPPGTSDPRLRRLLNIVEEMSIAAGVRMPGVYVLPEDGINAFAAGYSPDDAAVAVTHGALKTLSRDELQGVIAHEFSHILNGDMRLNIRLIGLLFGILLLAIIGRIVVRAGIASSGRRSSKDKGGAALIMTLFGLALIIIGCLGVFFGRLIQAAVSRQREFLADASAVQFTRNPDGIAGALKKIGAAGAGSRISSPHAAETSHLFFASALKSSFGGLLATHPPLIERIKAIDPAFDGDFLATGARAPNGAKQKPRVSGETQRAAAPPPLPIAPAIPPATVTAPVFLSALAALEAPDLQKGAAILNAIPALFRDAARDMERARPALLLLFYQKQNAEVREKQDAIVARALGTTERVAFLDLAAQIETVPSWTRIALGDLALSVIRHLDSRMIDSTLDAVDALIAADGQVSLHEHALRKVIQRNLRPPERQGAPVKTCAPLAGEISRVLGAVARAGSSVPAAQQSAFDAGAAVVREAQPDISLAMPPEADAATRDAAGATDLTRALDRLDAATPAVKQVVIAALVRAISDDGKIDASEQDLLRATAAALNCPAPVLAA